MKKDTPYSWSEVRDKLAKDLPGLTETDFQFVETCVGEIADHLMRSSDKSHDDVMTALNHAGIVVPDPVYKAPVEGEMSESIFAGEGAGLQEFR